MAQAILEFKFYLYVINAISSSFTKFLFLALCFLSFLLKLSYTQRYHIYIEHSVSAVSQWKNSTCLFSLFMLAVLNWEKKTNHAIDNRYKKHIFDIMHTHSLTSISPLLIHPDKCTQRMVGRTLLCDRSVQEICCFFSSRWIHGDETVFSHNK